MTLPELTEAKIAAEAHAVPSAVAPTAVASQAGDGRELVIRPGGGYRWTELIEYRELLYFLVWRDVKVRYKQTVLGIAWAVLQPLFGMAVFTVIFGKFAKMPSDGLPYAVFVFAGLLPWTFFATGVTQASQSLLNQQHLVTKIYFPRVLVPVASFGTALIDLAVSLVILAVLMAIYGVAPSWSVLWLPFLVIQTLVVGVAVGLFLAALTVAYRDFRFVVPFMIQVWMYLSPVVYPVTLVPEKYRWVLALNPVAGIIDGFRSSLLGSPWKITPLLISASISTVLLLAGLSWFRRTERQLVDVI